MNAFDDFTIFLLTFKMNRTLWYTLCDVLHKTMAKTNNGVNEKNIQYIAIFTWLKKKTMRNKVRLSPNTLHICKSNEIKIYKPFTQKWYGRQWTEKWTTPRKYRYDIWSGQYSGVVVSLLGFYPFFLTHFIQCVVWVHIIFYFQWIASSTWTQRNKLRQTNVDKPNHRQYSASMLNEQYIRQHTN